MTVRRRLLASMVLTLWLLLALNPDLGNPFARSVPVESWFQHRLQWDPIVGCGTEMCR